MDIGAVIAISVGATALLTTTVCCAAFYFWSKRKTNKKDSQASGDAELAVGKILDRVELETPLERGEREMIEGVLTLGDLTAADVMIHRTDVEAIPIDASADEIKRIVEETAYSRFPVYQGDFDKIVGILSARKYLLNLASESPVPIGELLFAPHYEPETLSADKLLERMRKSASHMIVVIDEYGGNSGIVTMEDLLEELVGSIYDETDDPRDDGEIFALPNGAIRVSGEVGIERIEKQLGIEIIGGGSEDDVGALIFSHLSEIPEDGKEFTLEFPCKRTRGDNPPQSARGDADGKSDDIDEDKPLTLRVTVRGLVSRRVEYAEIEVED